MPKPRSSDAKLARLRELRRQPCGPETVKALRTSLRDASNFVVAEAAEIAGEQGLGELTPDLVAAFERLLEDPEQRDKLCRAKIAIVEALNKLEFSDDAFYLRGIRYVQFEPVYGGSVDVAVPVRVGSAFALVRLRHRGVMPLLVDLLADPEKGARAGAAQALTYSGTEAAGLLLRLKARVGDADPEVIGECFSGILELTPDTGVSFVAEFLACPNDAIQEAALLALGSSRRPEAFEVLKSFSDGCSGDLQEVAHVALALLRLPAANDYLLTLVGDESQETAASALSALAVHRYDERVRERAAAAVAKTGNSSLRAIFDKRFRSEGRRRDGN